MLDALSALKNLFTHSSARGHRRRPEPGPRLLNLHNRATSNSPPTLRDAAPPRPPKPDPLRRFAIPAGHVQMLAPLMQKHRKLLDPDFALPQLHAAETVALDSFFATRSQLVDAALGTPAHALGERRPWPDLAPSRTQAHLLEQLFERSSGLVIGENHAAQSSKLLLIEHMDELRKLGVTTLYLEHLQTELHQDDLDRLHITGTLSPALARFLAEQDTGHRTHAPSGATFRNLVDAATRAGMRIVALDLMASYNLRGAQGTAAHPAQDALDIRIKVMNHVAATRIQHDQRQQRSNHGTQRWVALVGDAHAGAIDDTVGLAAQLGVPSLRVEDTSPSWWQGVRVGCDQMRAGAGSLGRGGGMVQCDYLLKVPARDGRIRQATLDPCSAAEALRQHTMHQTMRAVPQTRSA